MAFLIYENHSGTKAVPLDKETAIFNIGRSMDNHLRLREDSMISRYHCTLSLHQETGEYILRDLGSSNGTYLNEYCLSDSESVISDMDRIAVGNMIFIFMTAESVQYTMTETATIMVNSSTPDISSPEESLMTETARLNTIIPPLSEKNRSTTTVYPTLEGFEIISILGCGGSNNATTYLAYQTTLKQSVAVKVFEAATLSAEQKEEFLKHVLPVEQLQHENIVSCIDAGCNGNSCFLAMQYTEEGNLAQKLASGTLNEILATEYISKLVDAMIYASNAGIAHYNITPNNILFLKNGEPVISDFGLAGWVAKSFQINRIFFFGSTKYMTPEQMLDKAQDWTCDQYALGAIYYEMIVGKPVFDAPSIYALIEKHMREKVRFPSGINISAKTRDIICRMMGKIPADRFENWQALATALKSSSSPLSSSAKSRKNIPLQSKGMSNIVKKNPGIQIPVKKRKVMLKK